MSFPSRASRRVLAAAVGAGAVMGSTVFASLPSAVADPPPPPAPGCSAGDFEQVKADVSTATAGYMFSHPDVNAFFSTLKGQPRDQIRTEVSAYLDANPQTKSDLAGLRQPLRDMRDRCQ